MEVVKCFFLIIKKFLILKGYYWPASYCVRLNKNDSKSYFSPKKSIIHFFKYDLRKRTKGNKLPWKQIKRVMSVNSKPFGNLIGEVKFSGWQWANNQFWDWGRRGARPQGLRGSYLPCKVLTKLSDVIFINSNILFYTWIYNCVLKSNEISLYHHLLFQK